MNNQYHKFLREEWKMLPANRQIPLTDNELNDIKSINDHLSKEDVFEIYSPLLQLLDIKIRHHKATCLEKNTLIRKNTKIPFIISITGSVAVGKSTTARLLQKLLTWYYPSYEVSLITTDGFLYTTKELIEKNLLNKKGFPETYNTQELINTLTKIKSGEKNIKIPLYSHETYDIIKDKYITINHPDILIVEGINILQNSFNKNIYLNNFFDFSLFIDAEIANIKQWYLERFNSLLEVAKNNPKNYYYKFSNAPYDKALEIANNAWENINQPNLEKFILPSKKLVDIILHKKENHIIDYLFIRKY